MGSVLAQELSRAKGKRGIKKGVKAENMFPVKVRNRKTIIRIHT